ncbi:MAG: restriction endonuclease [bacterium]
MTNRLTYITKSNGTKELFEEEKLADSLLRSGGSQVLVDKVLKHIENEMVEGMSTSEIYHHAFEVLRRESIPVASRYSLRRALTELGPVGFPFEKLVAEIFKTQGYETLTDQVVHGHCVPHEMDVVAWNDTKLIMVEAKFHNEFGLKSDIKTVLYVKARFDDLKTQQFSFGGKKDRTLTEGWLVTNTKFTEQAIQYGECQKLKMIGWNYPAQGNLNDLIVAARLHPFTALATLSLTQKHALLGMGIILCKQITPALLHAAGVDEVKMKDVLQELSQICQ